jgi:hypothetical protein
MVQGKARWQRAHIVPRDWDVMSRWAAALALHFDDSALGFYPGSDVLGSLQVGDVGQRIGDADRRAAARVRRRPVVLLLPALVTTAGSSHRRGCRPDRPAAL